MEGRERVHKGKANISWRSAQCVSSQQFHLMPVSQRSDKTLTKTNLEIEKKEGKHGLENVHSTPTLIHFVIMQPKTLKDFAKTI